VTWGRIHPDAGPFRPGGRRVGDAAPWGTLLVVRVLVAPDSFTGTLSASQAAEAISTGWRRTAPGDEVESCPLSDGGPGFVDVLHGALGGRLLSVTALGPAGDPARGFVLLVTGEDGAVTGYVESAQACGLHLLAGRRPDPRVTTTAGVGALLRAAREAGACRIVVGLGGSGTNDAGAGMLDDLITSLPPGPGPGTPAGRGQAGRLARGGGALDGVTAADLAGLAAVRQAWSAVELVIACDVDVPLLGPRGASLGFSPQKGAAPNEARALERALARFAEAAAATPDLPRGLAAAPGAGAAGGLGFGLLLLGARRVPGVRVVLDAVRFADRVRRCDLLVTGEGRFDWQSLRGKAIAGAVREAAAAGTPAVVIAGQVVLPSGQARGIGVEEVHPVARTPEEVEAALGDPEGTLADRAARVALAWPRRPLSPTLGNRPPGAGRSPHHRPPGVPRHGD
jgi:glycerate kinase